MLSSNKIRSRANKNISHLLNTAINKSPHLPAFMVKDKNKKSWNQVTYYQLRGKINACHNIISDNMISIGDRIIYKGKNSIEWAAWNIASSAWGCTWVPLYSNQSEEHLRHIVNDCHPKLIITDDISSIPFTGVHTIENTIHPCEYDFKHEIDVDNSNNIAKIIFSS